MNESNAKKGSVYVFHKHRETFAHCLPELLHSLPYNDDNDNDNYHNLWKFFSMYARKNVKKKHDGAYGLKVLSFDNLFSLFFYSATQKAFYVQESSVLGV